MEAKVDIPMNVNGGGPKKQKRKKQRMLVELLLDYAKNSTLHGLRYITDPGVSIIERFFWGITFTISAVLCFVFIQQIYHKKWVETPVIVSLNDQMASVGTVPFPSITICPEQKVMLSRYNFTSEVEKYDKKNSTNELRDKSITKFEDISIILCRYTHFRFPNRKCSNTSTIDNILEVSPTQKEVISSCKWRGAVRPYCHTLFTKVLTKEGVCYNFNSLAAKEIFKYDSIQRDYSYLDSTTESKNWTAEQSYLNTDSKAYPWRGRNNEAEPDLELVLKSSANENDTLCGGATKGYKIYLQHPTDFPQASLSYYAASPHKVLSVALKSNIITTSSSLRDYLPNVRKCYFPGEHPLQYFQIYTQKNCELECQSKFVFEKCGCVRFYMPHNDSESICAGKRYFCIKKALDELDELQLKAELNFEVPTCGCYPACNSIDYNAETIKMDYDFQTDEKIFRDIMEAQNIIDFEPTSYIEKTEFSKILVYFKEPRFVIMRRSELYSWIEILANFGGLLGLFLGFSFLSLIEIIYFATIRLCCILKRDLKAEKKNAGDRSE